MADADCWRQRSSLFAVRCLMHVRNLHRVFNQHKEPPARVLHEPDEAQSTRPPESWGTSMNVSAFSPELVCAVAVITPFAADETLATYFVAGEQPVPPTQGIVVTAVVLVFDAPVMGLLGIPVIDASVAVLGTLGWSAPKFML